MDSYICENEPEILSFDVGTKHLAYCLLYNGNNYKFNILDISANTPKDRINNLYNSLNNLPIPKKVIIEQQVAANEIAMTIQTAIEMFYLCHGILIRNIIIYNPKDKFKYQGYKSFKGKEHKQLSISYARNIIEKTNMDNLTIFEKFTKKDDVADALCMAMFIYLDNNKDKILYLIKHSS